MRASSLISSPPWVIFSEWVQRSFIHSLILIVYSSLSCSVWVEACSCHVSLRPQGQLILTSVSGLLVLYFPLIFLIPFMPCLKISFFLPISFLSSRRLCFRFSLSMSFSALHISTVRRAFHLSCCLTSFWKVGLGWKNPSPCMAFLVGPLISSLGCLGAVAVSAALSKKILLVGYSMFYSYVLFFLLHVFVLSKLYPVAI